MCSLNSKQMVDTVTENFQNRTLVLDCFIDYSSCSQSWCIFNVVGWWLCSCKNSSVGLQTRLRARSRDMVRFMAGTRNSARLESVKTKHFVKWSTWGVFLGVERHKFDCNHWPLCIAEVEKVWMFTSTPPPPPPVGLLSYRMQGQICFTFNRFWYERPVFEVVERCLEQHWCLYSLTTLYQLQIFYSVYWSVEWAEIA